MARMGCAAAVICLASLIAAQPTTAQRPAQTQATTAPGTRPATAPATAEGGEGWRKAFGPKEVLQRVRFAECDDYLPNPHRGTATFQRFNGDDLYPGERWNDRAGPETFADFQGDPSTLKNDRYPRTTIAYCRWVWSVIEPEKGKYRWDVIDGALKAAHQRGQTLQMRIQPTVGAAGLPQWVRDEGMGRDPKGRGPDYNSPVYVKYWCELIRAFGKRYDGHEDLESFDVAYAGPCGETGGNSTPQTARALTDAYLEGFAKTRLIVMLGTEGGRYAMSKRPEIGWRVDCYGDLHTTDSKDVPPGTDSNHMMDTYPRAIFLNKAEERWKTAPVVLETCWTVGYWRKSGWDIDAILAWGLRQHASVFMPKSCAIPDEWRAKIDAFDRQLGYRYALRQVTLPLEVRQGQRATVDVSLDNVGVAPIYTPYRLALRLSQKGAQAIVLFREDIRSWLPGSRWFSEDLALPAVIRPGVAKVDLAIVDDATNKPVVHFAVKERQPDGWVPLRYIDVLGPDEPSRIDPDSPYLKDPRSRQGKSD
ncbi:MAG: DUF4832 domain-containing protein [Phycisphaerae bacterium]